MSSNLPLISVLIPVYNVEAFVKEAILSICNQSYKNIEIIVVDDCSTDNTYNIVAELVPNDARIKLFKNYKNSKIVKTLNFALEQSKGDFIARMDGDDISAPQRLEKQLNFLLKHPQYALVGSHVTTIDSKNKIIGKQEMPIKDDIITKTIKYASPVLHIWLAKREVYNKLEGYREIPGAEDYDFLLRMHSLGLSFTNLNSFEYSVRIRDGNTTSTIGFNQRLMSNYVVELYEMRLRSNKDNFSSDNVKDYINYYSKYKEDFDKSNTFLKTAFMAKAHKNFFEMFIFLTRAVFKSRFQAQYLYKRILFKLLSKG
ncbi:glycosyltransferase family 2 protein [Acinetobacter baumannii]|uniref:glycosyltransferase family 2 protein n=1 Tax=Acinetobacter baumannii TaxID=470 RepID=UPI00234DB052|nr:glycosyltransferase family 2 protein [Acinetobacter baumannii]MDC7326067.1 glycosyltransferase family 2 protein [Acinetobacter baumannii]MDC7343599.1 glycosyltransferase family 2 protein [Acinetobacter baumannii]MDC7362092.1 glycosyltransferase family 2 protein [Acinetobacter baumannii]MDC7471033.1 glycosyltransferase family 2 protein [Acinetobacter baumannii]MDC7478962.1 glycosyltransferase family 2 protein [Acinetobacter baumannii]